MNLIDRPEITVAQFDGDETAMATIAALHLRLRYWQRWQGQAKFFSGIEDSQPDLSNLRERYIETGGNFFVATDGSSGNTVGFVALRNDGEGQATLKRMAVLPEYHRRGIGSMLVATAIDWATQAGLSRICLETGYYENARPLYEKFGFEVVGENRANEDYLMELTIPQQPPLEV